MSLKGAIFDIDGVIIATAGLHYKAWQKVFAEYGKKFTFDEFKKTIDGMPREKGAAFIFPDFSKKEIKKICVKKQIYFNRIIKKEKPVLYRDAVRFLKTLKKEKIKTAIATSSKNAGIILKKLSLYKYFDVDAKGAFLKRGKPFPDIFLKAAQKLKLKPEECVVFEDSLNGIISAKRAKMKCVAICRDGKKLKNADIIIKDFNEITIDKIKKLFEKGKKFEKN